ARARALAAVRSACHQVRRTGKDGFTLAGGRLGRPPAVLPHSNRVLTLRRILPGMTPKSIHPVTSRYPARISAFLGFPVPSVRALPATTGARLPDICRTAWTTAPASASTLTLAPAFPLALSSP